MSNCTCKVCVRRGDDFSSCKKDVFCAKCKESYHRQFPEPDPNTSPFIGIECASYMYTYNEDGGCMYVSNVAAHPEITRSASVFISSYYGSEFDTCLFRYGRKQGIPLEKCPNWMQEAVKDQNSLCDDCIRDMIRSHEIRWLSENRLDGSPGIPYPRICDSCDLVFEDAKNPPNDIRCVVIFGKKRSSKLRLADTKTPLYNGVDYWGVDLQLKLRGPTPDWWKPSYAICEKCFDELDEGYFVEAKIPVGLRRIRASEEEWRQQQKQTWEQMEKTLGIRQEQRVVPDE